MTPKFDIRKDRDGYSLHIDTEAEMRRRMIDLLAELENRPLSTDKEENP